MLALEEQMLVPEFGMGGNCKALSAGAAMPIADIGKPRIRTLRRNNAVAVSAFRKSHS
jgi:hypothetical protein